MIEKGGFFRDGGAAFSILTGERQAGSVAYVPLFSGSEEDHPF
jgi:hypothetical protein